jgi:hypothetical protein
MPGFYCRIVLSNQYPFLQKAQSVLHDLLAKSYSGVIHNFRLAPEHILLHHWRW